MYRRSFELELTAFPLLVARRELFLRENVGLTGTYRLALFVQVGRGESFFEPTFTASPRRGDVQPDAGDEGKYGDDA